MTIGVGVIGVGSAGSWAAEAHVPAIRAVGGLSLRAVAARDRDRGEQIAREVGAETGYGDARSLIDDPQVEVVVVGAPVPAHRELVEQAVAAGKAVTTEWPLGVSDEENGVLADAVTHADVLGVVDLQARHAAATVRALALLEAGAVGRLLTVSVVSSTAAFGPVIPPAARYLEDPATGMNLTTIQTAHTLDLAIRFAGPLDRVAALGTTQFPEVRVDGSDETIERTIADHVGVQGRFAEGGALVAEIRGGCDPADAPFRMLLRGTDGTLELVGGGPRGFQASALALRHDGADVALDDVFADLPASARNVAGVYRALERDLRTGSRTTPSFAHARTLGHLVTDVLASSPTQAVKTPARPWPQRS